MHVLLKNPLVDCDFATSEGLEFQASLTRSTSRFTRTPSECSRWFTAPETFNTFCVDEVPWRNNHSGRLH